MKRLYIIKAGTTYPVIKERFGDFDTWTLQGLGKTKTEARVLDAVSGAALPIAADCAGVILTGSHSMVTDDLPWSVELEEWIPSVVEAGVPFLGICYGHQLLARAAGGEVGFHPRGMEIGTVEIGLLPDCAGDPLFRSLPQQFSVHAAHSQTVLRLPRRAVRLAVGGHEPNHAFRIGGNAWGIQFHPEYDAAIMRSYIAKLADELVSAGFDVRELLDAVAETPLAARTLRNFARIVEN
ncbi:MAG TPA: glutamine amidotransferase [Syntrophorhabdaceae bacterium]|nr:glutamine amidotransferase [Syntrophorhabdaceae bacterium]